MAAVLALGGAHNNQGFLTLILSQSLRWSGEFFRDKIIAYCKLFYLPD